VRCGRTSAAKERRKVRRAKGGEDGEGRKAEGRRGVKGRRANAAEGSEARRARREGRGVGEVARPTGAERWKGEGPAKVARDGRQKAEGREGGGRMRRRAKE
jgi:hypothetical protein